MIKRLLAVLCLCASAWATTTVSGNIKNLGTSAVSAGTFVRFYLRGCAGNLPRVNGTAIIAPTLGNVYYFDFVPNASGAISGTLYSTRDATGLLGGDIECGGSTTAVWYGFVPFVNGKAGPETPIHALNTATFDISNITPITTNPVIAAPGGDGTYLRKDGGNSPVTGDVTFSGAGTGLTVSNNATVSGALTAATINNICMADQQVGADASLKILACWNSLPSTGGIINALGLQGAQTISVDPRGNNDKPAWVQLGAATYSYDPTTMLWTLPTGSHVTGHGTVIKSTRTDGNGTSTIPYQWSGLLNPAVYSTTGSITSGQNTLTVADASHASVGEMVVVYGAKGGMNGTAPFGTQSTTINQGGSMLAGDTSVTVVATGQPAGGGGSFPSADGRSNFILIDSEIMQYGSVTATTFATLTRGMFGTTAATHTNGTTIFQLGTLVTFITSKSGSVLTLQDAATFTVANATTLIGSQQILIDGDLTLDCNYTNKALAVSNPCLGVGLTASRFVTIAPSVKIQNALDGVSMTAAWNNRIGGSYRNLGRPPNSLGFDVLCFEQCNFNRFDTSTHENGDVLFAADDRSNSSTIFSGASNGNTAFLAATSGGAYTNGVILEGGSSNNTVYAAAITTGNVAGTAGVFIDTGQWTANPTPKNNTVHYGTVNSPGQNAIETTGYTGGANSVIGGQIIAGAAGTIAAGDRLLTTANVINQINAISFQRSAGAPASPDIFGTGSAALVIGDSNGVLFGSAVTFVAPGAAGTTQLGSSSLPFNKLIMGTAATNNFTITPAATAAARAVTVPDPGAATNLGLNYNATNGVYQSKRGVAGCTTGGAAGNSCVSDITVTWPTAFADANYSVACTGSTPSNAPSAPFVVSTTKLAATVHINYFAITAAAASYATIDCIAVHD